MIRGAIALQLLSLCGCQHTTIIGAIDVVPDGGDALDLSGGGCAGDTDCMPPTTICGPDGRCIPGCVGKPFSCPSGSVCDVNTGNCKGGNLNKSCTTDVQCDPPDIVCQQSTMLCAPGCNLDPTTCYGGWICNFSKGRCCNPIDPTCRPAKTGGCNSDGDCAAKPGTICQLGTCTPACATSGCGMPMLCAMTGHCGPPGGVCARDAECDVGSYCSAGGTCTVAPVGGASGCAGGDLVTSSCNELRSVVDYRQCIGPPGPAICPYCIDGSCYHPGLCASEKDCHRGDACTGGLCAPTMPECPSTVSTAAVVAGGYAAGRELCVRDVVVSALVGSNGDHVQWLGGANLATVITPQYLGLGVKVPPLGMTVTMHGVVRWDEGRKRWELHPVDWWGP